MTAYPAEREAAAKLIEERGWWHGQHQDTHDLRCVATAVEGVVRHFDLRDAILRELVAELGIACAPGHELSALILWNDHPSRDKAEVLAALRRGTYTADTSPAADTELES